MKLTDKQFKDKAQMKLTRGQVKQWKKYFYMQNGGKQPKRFIRDAIIKSERIMTKTGSLR